MSAGVRGEICECGLLKTTAEREKNSCGSSWRLESAQHTEQYRIITRVIKARQHTPRNEGQVRIGPNHWRYRHEHKGNGGFGNTASRYFGRRMYVGRRFHCPCCRYNQHRNSFRSEGVCYLHHKCDSGVRYTINNCI